MQYDLPDELKGRLWGGGWRGQTQKWFLARFTGDDDDIDLGTGRPEFSDWKWVRMAELPDIIVPFKRRLYEALITRFRHLAEEA